MLARSSFRAGTRASVQFTRFNSVKTKPKSFMDKIGDEKTKESQKTIKIVRMIGAGSIVTVLCSLFWASSLTAPVKETYEDVPDLSRDVRKS